MRYLLAIMALLPACGASAAGIPLAREIAAQVLADIDRQDRTFDPMVNPGGEVMGAATWDDASGAVDGVKNGSYGFHTTFSDSPWWQVDLGKSYEIGRIVAYNRNENGLEKRAFGMRVLVSDDAAAWQEVFSHTDEPFGGVKDGKPLEIDLRGKGVGGRWVRCQVPSKVSFHLDEVEVYPVDQPETNVALLKPADQSSAGRSSTPKGLNPRAEELAFRLDSTQKILDRAGALLQHTPAADRAARAEIDKLQDELGRLRSGDRPTLDARRELHRRAALLVRELLLQDPLLDFRDILFVKREAGVLAHMCDQYFGSLSRPGGGLYVLEDFRTDPKLRDVIGDALPVGNFLSPDLSYDGRRVLFSYAQGDPERRIVFDRSAKWAYHVYTVNLDGTDLRRLTDGPWDDIHPRWLPDGDILFVSTRRGGETRCSGRPVPTYTLHRMRPDGSEILRLSCHETHEWHPAVGNEGSILYTRWDYVDRHTNLAHSVWSCRPDGSAAMAVYGNYNHDKKPWGEWFVRPVPGSHKLLAIAGAHHGYAAGSVIGIDPLAQFDGKEPVTRLTPEVPFPEAEGYPNSAYTSPWPLSEHLYLVAYSPEWNTRTAQHTVPFGLYLQDAAGNRALLYRDGRISSEEPIPVRARPVPMSYPMASRQDAAPEGRFLLADVAQSLQPLPDDRIAALRIVQILPKTTYRADDPKMSAARQIGARQLLGTVPVEPDGSAYFKAPAGVPVYFQALDEAGMAVQTMRSITYLQPGETRSCVGCHEQRQMTPQVARPAAGLREPAVPLPGPDGSRPFSYIRLVQPVLDRHCIRCHSAEGEAAKLVLTGEFASDKEPFTRSYKTLARKELVPWFDSINGGEWIPESQPGRIGARASKLIAMLRAGHHEVSLSEEDLQRLVLWVDLNIPFYGCYEPGHVAMQRRGEVVPLEEMLQ